MKLRAINFGLAILLLVGSSFWQTFAAEGLTALSTPSTSAQAHPSDASSSSESIFELRFAPTVGISIPSFTQIGLECFVDDVLSFGGSFGAIKRGFRKNTIQANIITYETHGRWYPWQESFFFGAILGHRVLHIRGNEESGLTKRSRSFDLEVEGDITLRTSYVTPHVGWHSRWGSGFLLGTDVGWQIPFSSQGRANARLTDDVVDDALRDTKSYGEVVRLLKTGSKKAAGLSLPYWTIVRVGWIF